MAAEAQVNKSLKKQKKQAVLKYQFGSPLVIKWPVLSAEIHTEALQLVENILRPLAVLRRESQEKKRRRRLEERNKVKHGNTPRAGDTPAPVGDATVPPEPKRQRKDEGDAGAAGGEEMFLGHEHDVAIAMRDGLVLGINAVMRGLERNELGMVVVCVETWPTTLVQHLLGATHANSVPVLPLAHGCTHETLGAVAGLKSLTVFGVKRAGTDEGWPGRDALQSLLPLCPPSTQVAPITLFGGSTQPGTYLPIQVKQVEAFKKTKDSGAHRVDQ